jgi:hypothetical protein
MADLKPIEFPEELKRHNLSEQELSPLTPQQQALAKDWNVIKRQIEWIINHDVMLHNILADHDKKLEDLWFWFKVVTILTGGGGSLIGIITWLTKASGIH